jgi:WD40 repeat protein
VTNAASLCANPYNSKDFATGWPEGPVYILFHRKSSSHPWARNPAIQALGLEAGSPASAHTLVCIEETLEEKGKYDSGVAAYQPHWDTTIVSLAGRATFRALAAPTFVGEEPPYMKYKTGPGVGKPPVQPLLRWLRLLVDQKVAHFRMRLLWPLEVSGSSDFAGLLALAISSDGTKLAAARQSRNGSSSPIVVFDLNSGRALATLRRDYFPRHMAISKSGNWIATEGMFSHGIDILETSTGNPVRKLDTSTIDSLTFAPDDTLAVAGESKVVFWNIESQSPVRSVAGSRAFQSPGGAWLLAAKDADAITIKEMETGRSVASFPGTSWLLEDQYVLSRDATTLAEESGNGANLYAAGSSRPQRLTLPSILMDSVATESASAIAATPDGAIFAGKGFVGIASAANPQPRFFANGDDYIKKIVVSSDGKLLVLGNNESELYVWELR